MKKIFLILVACAFVVVGVSAFVLTRNGELKTTAGTGWLSVEGKSFEAFPLPDYAAKFVTEDFKSYLVEVEPGIKIHVLEVGAGYPVYLQHGMPTSGFLYRKVAQALPTDQFRLIMPTIVGFGFSSKIPASNHSLENHAWWMSTLLARLALEELIFVGHDWGGMVGMAALARSPDLLKGVVVLNTVLNAPTAKKELSTPLKIANTPVVGEIVLEGLVSIFEQLPAMQADPNSMPEDVIQLYGKPVIDSGNAKAPLAMMRMSADSPDHPTAPEIRNIEAYIEQLDIPVEIVWGMNDSILGPRLKVMREIFPEARVTKTQAGHFLQEETPKPVASAVQRIHQQIQGM